MGIGLPDHYAHITTVFLVSSQGSSGRAIAKAAWCWDNWPEQSDGTEASSTNSVTRKQKRNVRSWAGRTNIFNKRWTRLQTSCQLLSYQLLSCQLQTRCQLRETSQKMKVFAANIKLCMWRSMVTVGIWIVIASMWEIQGMCAVWIHALSVYGELWLQLVPWSMSGIQKILHAECEGFFVCSQPFCRQSVSISLFVFNLFCRQSVWTNFAGISGC